MMVGAVGAVGAVGTDGTGDSEGSGLKTATGMAKGRCDEEGSGAAASSESIRVEDSNVGGVGEGAEGTWNLGLGFTEATAAVSEAVEEAVVLVVSEADPENFEVGTVSADGPGSGMVRVMGSRESESIVRGAGPKTARPENSTDCPLVDAVTEAAGVQAANVSAGSSVAVTTVTASRLNPSSSRRRW